VSVTRDQEREPLTDEDVQYVQALADIAGNTLSTARVLADSALVMEELRQQADLMEYMSDALIACDAERRIVSWNTGAEHIYGYTRAEAIGCDVFALLATQFFASDGVPAEADDVLAEAHGTGSWRGELRERRADGAPLTIMSSLTARLDHGHLPSGLVVVNRDVTDQRREEHRALHDALTGLPNRRMLNHRLYDSFARACRNNWSLAVLFIDLDGFKPINDTYGHAAGDEVLKATATRLAHLVRRTDTVARLGGDEFVVVLEDAGTVRNISDIADRLVETVAAPIEIGSTTVVVRPSIGIVVAEGSEGLETTPEQLLEAADEAMYVAKRQRLGIWLSPA
jgi:diguanylate cyclase (GGDEF)-like protein/PAS domain S-box-containing protein